MIIGFQIPKTEHFKLCQGNFRLISNQGISLDKALALRKNNSRLSQPLDSREYTLKEEIYGKNQDGWQRPLPGNPQYGEDIWGFGSLE
jgi:hypothetical protein